MVLFIWDYLKPGLELYQNILSKNSILKKKKKQHIVQAQKIEPEA